MRLFECGIRYEKTLENGMQKKVTELYIVDALSFTEAEGRVIKEMSCYLSGEFEVVSEKITNYSEIVMSDNAEADKWYKVKINYIVIDEKTEKEKKTAVYYLVQAKDIDDARRMTNKHMEGTMMDWDCEAVSETKIMDVFLYEADGANKPNEPNKAGGTDKPDKTDKAISKAVKRFVDGIPDGQKVTISATGCEDVVIDKTHGHEEDDA
jgi:hypothetical protein